MYPRDPIRRANGGTNLKAAARHMHPSRRFHLPAPCGPPLERPPGACESRPPGRFDLQTALGRRGIPFAGRRENILRRPVSRPNKLRPCTHGLRGSASTRSQWTRVAKQLSACNALTVLGDNASGYGRMLFWGNGTHRAAVPELTRGMPSVARPPKSTGQRAAVRRGSAAPRHACMCPRNIIRRALGGANLQSTVQS